MDAPPRSPCGGESQETPSPFPWRVGDFVLVLPMPPHAMGVRRGILRFLGETHFSSGVWAGVELVGSKGKNDGSIQGQRYFQALDPEAGIFVRPELIEAYSHDGFERAAAVAAANSSVASATASQPQNSFPSTGDAENTVVTGVVEGGSTNVSVVGKLLARVKELELTVSEKADFIASLEAQRASLTSKIQSLAGIASERDNVKELLEIRQVELEIALEEQAVAVAEHKAEISELRRELGQKACELDEVAKERDALQAKMASESALDRKASDRPRKELGQGAMHANTQANAHPFIDGKFPTLDDNSACAGPEATNTGTGREGLACTAAMLAVTTGSEIDPPAAFSVCASDCLRSPLCTLTALCQLMAASAENRRDHQRRLQLLTKAAVALPRVVRFTDSPREREAAQLRVFGVCNT